MGGRGNAVWHYLDRHLAAGRGARPAIATGDGVFTYEEVLRRVSLVGGALREAGVEVGDRVALVLPDAPDTIAFILGAMRIGAIPVPLHPGLADDDYRLICEDCRPRAMVLTPQHLERIAGLLPDRAQLALFVAGGEDGAGGRQALPVEQALAVAEPVDPVAFDLDQPALLQYTSGSTGSPKGVVHRHGALVALPRGFGSYLELRDGDVCFSAAKLFFGYGLGNSLFFPFDAGCTTFLRAEPSDPVGVLEAIEVARPTVFFAGPALYRAILALIGASSRFDLSGIHLFVSAGEALDPRTFEEWEQRFGTPILDGLGSTECLHVFAAFPPTEVRPGRLGPAVPGHRIRIVDEKRESVGPGEAGVVEVSGPAVSRNYWNRPEETRRTMDSGWVRTGDILRVHEDGSLEFLGREDDVFKVRGMKVSPVAVERRLLEHPAVRECAVVAGQDRFGLQAPHAVVCVEEGWEADEALSKEIRAALAAVLPRHEVPRQIHFAGPLPRGSTGKLSRGKVREAQAGLR